MVHLSENWLTEHLIDAEYKQFVLLAYLEGIKKQFQNHLLYPALSDLVEHYRNLHKTKKEFDYLNGRFPGELSKIDLNQLKIIYEKSVVNDLLISELEEIIAFSIPKMQETLEEGKNVYQKLEQLLRFEPVGLVPLNTTAGYIFIEGGGDRNLHVYEYSLSVYTNENDSFRSLSTGYLTCVQRSPFETPESVKLNLLKDRKSLPNPATYYFYTNSTIPLEQSFLPIAKRMLIKEISRS